MVSFLYPKTWLLYVSSAVLGAGAALIWTGQGAYLSRCSNDETIARNSGVFWAMLQARYVSYHSIAFDSMHRNSWTSIQIWLLELVNSIYIHFDTDFTKKCFIAFWNSRKLLQSQIAPLIFWFFLHFQYADRQYVRIFPIPRERSHWFKYTEYCILCTDFGCNCWCYFLCYIATSKSTIWREYAWSRIAGSIK